MFKAKLKINDISAGNVVYGRGIHNNFMYYVGQNGEWRYMAYSSGGDSISNPYFPPDFTSGKTVGNYGYDDYPWDYTLGCQKQASMWDNTKNIVNHQY
ncbi:hypothetical protein G9F71_000725 [Clostridium sp. FP2]|uniref:hypothetical protein n=1 Tax=Clostridium sp. FP2 TaxID=2724481 RepID=UPI0013E99BE7|nr:hypothetical protein [Clostridium sp. FP2]MBZ9621415.1 hypothetical protein [Clostridium sp. FP2]